MDEFNGVFGFDEEDDWWSGCGVVGKGPKISVESILLSMVDKIAVKK